MPWAEWRRLGLGVLKWPPATFWDATPGELLDAWEGHAMANGIKTDRARRSDAGDLRALLASAGGPTRSIRRQ